MWHHLPGLWGRGQATKRSGVCARCVALFTWVEGGADPRAGPPQTERSRMCVYVTHLGYEMDGSETGSYLRLIDVAYHSTLGLRVIEKKKEERDGVGRYSLAGSN